MSQNKINIDLSSLWENTDNLFTVRFNDLDDRRKELLSQRIKILAPQYRIRKESGPSQILISEILREINPIIFSEGDRDNDDGYYYDRFSRYSIQSIDGYNFKTLCQIIYRTLCTKKGLQSNDISHLAYLTCANRRKVRTFLDRLRRIEPTSNQRLMVNGQRIQPREIGISDIAYARQTAINGGAESLPNAMREITCMPSIDPLTSSAVRTAIAELASINRINLQAYQDTYQTEINNQ